MKITENSKELGADTLIMFFQFDRIDKIELATSYNVKILQSFRDCVSIKIHQDFAENIDVSKAENNLIIKDRKIKKTLTVVDWSDAAALEAVSVSHIEQSVYEEQKIDVNCVPITIYAPDFLNLKAHLRKYSALTSNVLFDNLAIETKDISKFDLTGKSASVNSSGCSSGTLVILGGNLNVSASDKADINSRGIYSNINIDTDSSGYIVTVGDTDKYVVDGSKADKSIHQGKTVKQ